MVESINELKDIKNLYRVFIASIVLQVIPVFGLQMFGMILFMVVLVWAYVLKMKYVTNPFGKSHAIHVIKTIWNFSSFLVIGLCIWGAIMYMNADQSAIDDYSAHMISTGDFSEEGIMNAYKQVLKDNWGLVLKSGIPTLLPSAIYLVFRIWTGSSNANCERKM